MRRPKTKEAFSPAERERAHQLLAIKVAYMMGRKLEEADWAKVYCTAKKIPYTGWSNLEIDIMHENLGVEHKMIRYKSSKTMNQAFGTTIMHPAATRSIRISSTDADPNEVMAEVLTQYANLIQAREDKVQEFNTTGKPADMRTGWLLWQDSLREFLYFEEEMLKPDPDDYRAEWMESGGGARKASKNLWIYEKETGRKRYSVTTEAGAKIQPYFDVPPPSDPNVYIFTVIGETVEIGKVRVWLTKGTAAALRDTLGNLEDFEAISDKVMESIQGITPSTNGPEEVEEAGVMVTLRQDAYVALTAALPGVSDEHCFQLLLEHIHSGIGSLAHP